MNFKNGDTKRNRFRIALNLMKVNLPERKGKDTVLCFAGMMRRSDIHIR
jgi:hypothetical protein